MYHVLIVDDERNIQKAYQADIASAPDRYTLVESIASAADAELVCKVRPVDLILMDINTANQESGLAATKAIKQSFPNIKVIIATSYADPHGVELGRIGGADGFWYKDSSPIELLEVMDRTMAGAGYWPTEPPDVTVGAAKLSDFTPTELELLHQLVHRLSVKEVADAMFISEATVKFHLKNICRKVQCKNKTELLVLAIQSRVVLPDQD